MDLDEKQHKYTLNTLLSRSCISQSISMLTNTLSAIRYYSNWFLQ